MSPIKEAIEALEVLAGVAEALLMPSDPRIAKANAALAALRSMPAEPVAQIPDCGEAGHDEGRCGNASCMPGKWGNLLRNARDHAYDEEGYTLHPDLAEAVQEVNAMLTTPPPAPLLSDAERDVLAERERQKSVEGWTPEHDDEHGTAAMAAAAGCYAFSAAAEYAENTHWSNKRFDVTEQLWPWDEAWWKPSTPRRDLVKAGALILAEIERLDRASRGAK